MKASPSASSQVLKDYYCQASIMKTATVPVKTPLRSERGTCDECQQLDLDLTYYEW